MNLNGKQILAIGIALLGVIGASTTQLDILIGPTATKAVTALDTMLMSALSSVLAVLTGQGSLVKDVAAMPGVEKIVVNKDANQTLASVAVDPAQLKVEAKPQDEVKVNQTATGT